MNYADGYRDGSLAERRRAVLIALRAVDHKGAPSEAGHPIAHAIALAGDRLPVLIGPPPFGYTPFGERKLRDIPTFMEGTCSPFTAAGKAYIKDVERQACAITFSKSRAAYTQREMQVERLSEQVSQLQKALSAEKRDNEELRQIVNTVKKQSRGVIR